MSSAQPSHQPDPPPAGSSVPPVESRPSATADPAELLPRTDSGSPILLWLAGRRRHSWLWLLVILVMAGVGMGGWRSLTATDRQPERASSKSTPPPRPVTLTTLTTGEGFSRTQLLGEVAASQKATIRAQTSGVIQQVLVQAGDRIVVGTPLFRLDDADQRLALAEAQARLAQERSNLARLEVGTRSEIITQRQAAVQSAHAREQEAVDNLQRTTELVKEGALSQRLLVEARTAVDTAKGQRLAAEAALAEAKAGPIREEIQAQQANVAVAQSAVNQARLALQRTQITATTAGVVESRTVSVGDYVRTADPLITLVSGDRLDVFLGLPEALSGKIAPGVKVRLTARALPQWQGQATITGVVPATDATSRRQRVRLRLANPPTGLLPGMAVTGSLEVPVNTPGFVVSRDALTQRQNQWMVFTVVEGQAKQINVDLVADMGEQVAIASDQLRGGEELVLQGGDGLTDGAAVKVVRSP